MNRVRIIHSTIYRYSKPVLFAPHRIILRPREGHDVQVENQQLLTQPPSVLSWQRDIFGNSIAVAQFTRDANKLVINNDVTVTRPALHSGFASFKMGVIQLPLQYSELEGSVVGGYRAHVYRDETGPLMDWATAIFSPKEGADAVHLVERIMVWINGSIQYQRREEKGVQTPMETLRLGTGSCRDLATLMLEVVRALGFAGRFASGYLHATTSTAGLGATHAWIEVYMPGFGWLGCDPTLGEWISTKHIVTGVSSHPRGAMPITGAYIGEANVYRGLCVNVTIRNAD